MKTLGIKTISAVVIMMGFGSSAYANPCDDPVRAKSLGAYCKPAKSHPSSQGMLPKLDKNWYQDALREAPDNIARAADVTELTKLSTRQQIRILEKGIYSANFIKDDDSLIAFSERLQNNLGATVPEHYQDDLAHAYFTAGRYQDAYKTYKAWFTPKSSFNKDSFRQMARVAEDAGDNALAADVLEKMLSQSKKRYGGHAKQADFYLDIIRLRAKLKDRQALDIHSAGLSDLMTTRFEKQPLSKARYFEEAVSFLRGSNFTDLALKLEDQAVDPNVATLRNQAQTYEADCLAQSTSAGMDLVDIYKGESGLESKRFEASQTACELGEMKGCYVEAIFHLYGAHTNKNQEKAHAKFAQACADGLGDACHGAAMIHLQGGTSPDIEKTRYFHTLGCEKKSSRSCYALANNFMRPKDTSVVPDPKKARKYYKKACKLGAQSACIAAKKR